VPDAAAKIQRRIGGVVREQRLARKLTQEELAYRARLSLTYIGEIERGQRMVSVESLLRVAGALGFSGAELLQKAGL
jgi:transcriptional regulator with XRE-family HTH domain